MENIRGPLPLHPAGSPGLRVRFPDSPHPAFWLQAVWVGGAGTSGMLMPAVEGRSLEKERGEGRYLRSASRGRGLGPGRGVVNRQPPEGQE